MTDFAALKAEFHLPAGVIYLDGNSLGAQPLAVRDRVAAMLRDEWADMLIRGWNGAGWFMQPHRLGDRIGRLIGAPAGSTMVGDTLSIKVYQALAAALALNPDRKVVLSDTGNFPTDLYMAEGLIKAFGKDHTLKTVAPEAVEDALDETVAVVMLTEVDYRTGRLHDMKGLTAKAHAMGALTIWDLAHSAGALPVDVTAAHADFAIGCTYKYINAGPGAPAFIHVRPDLADRTEPVLSGWLGHGAPFDFELGYRPGDGISRMRVGTPPVIQMAALDAALTVWEKADIKDVRARSIALSERFIKEVEAQCPALTLASPRDPAQRGSQISFRAENGYAIMQALIARGVIGDFRAPDIIRFGIAPLYNDETDIRAAAAILADILNTAEWDQPEFHQKAAVT